MTSVPFAREGSRLRLVSTVWPSRWARHPALADGASTRHRMPAAASHTLRTRNPAHQQSRSGSQVRLQRYPMTADIRLAVSVIRTVFAQNHRSAATAADDHANTPNNKKSPSPSNAERGAMFHKGAKYSFMGYPCDISHLSLISGREFQFHARKLITVRRCAADCRRRQDRWR